MTGEQVANMFGEAVRMEKLTHYRKQVQDGFVDKVIPCSIHRKTAEFNAGIKMNPESFKVVAKSPAALKSKHFFYFIVEFKQDLKGFREEMTRKKQLYYIPVTMDELMARFVTNMERSECKDQFKAHKKVFMRSDLI